MNYKWELRISTCNPPPPDACPATPPALGSSCAPANPCASYDRSCSYGPECAPGQYYDTFACDVSSLSWYRLETPASCLDPGADAGSDGG